MNSPMSWRLVKWSNHTTSGTVKQIFVAISQVTATPVGGYLTQAVSRWRWIWQALGFFFGGLGSNGGLALPSALARR